MDWLKLLTLFLAVASIQTKADGPKKKIRIHLPQAVKHIHHHKKIYITNHPASSQYAPAFMPSSEHSLSVALPTKIALPAVTNIVPLNSIDVLQEQMRLPSIATSKILPLYRARGYYGPTHTALDEQEFDAGSLPEPTVEYVHSPNWQPLPTSNAVHLPPKRVKTVKLNEQQRKKPVRKTKSKPQTARYRPSSTILTEKELPVSSFHEQFYSDIDDSGTIRKIKRPPRIEKIVEGNTEHIHTYSEEHIHKVVFDEEPKYHIAGIPSYSAAPSINSLKNSHNLLPMASDLYESLSIGSMGTPPQYEYAAYNPRDVTHDHFFHDHGELPAGMDFSRDIFSLAPKVSYNSEGLQLETGAKRLKSKYSQKYKKHAKNAPNDYSYYESIYTSNGIKPTDSASLHISSVEGKLEDYRPISSFDFKDLDNGNGQNKVSLYYRKPSVDYARTKQKSNIEAPFSVSSKIIHDYKPSLQNYPNGVSEPSGLSLFDNNYSNFKDSFVNNLEYDNYASSSNVHNSRESNPSMTYRSHDSKDRKKSISTQHIRFEDRHLENPADLDLSSNDNVPSALDNVEGFDLPQFADSETPTLYTSQDNILNPQFFTMMTVKALQGEQMSVPEASNDNFQFAEAPPVTAIPYTTTIMPINVQTPRSDISSTEYFQDATSSKFTNKTAKENRPVMKDIQTVRTANRSIYQSVSNETDNHLNGRVDLKYGDKL